MNELCAKCNASRWAHVDQQELHSTLAYIDHKYVPRKTTMRFVSESERKRIATIKGEPLYPKKEKDNAD